MLRERYPLLADSQVEIVGSFIEGSTSLGIVETPETLLVLQAHAPSIDEGHGQQHIFFSREEGRALRNYQLVHPTIPWPKPTIDVAMTGPDTGVSTGEMGPRVPVQLVRAGTIQLWWGGETGEIWEAILEGHGLPQDQTPLLSGVCDALERALEQRGCRRVYSLARDPRYDDQYYRTFLSERGYAPSPKHQHKTQLAWVKHLEAA